MSISFTHRNTTEVTIMVISIVFDKFLDKVEPYLPKQCVLFQDHNIFEEHFFLKVLPLRSRERQEIFGIAVEEVSRLQGIGVDA